MSGRTPEREPVAGATGAGAAAAGVTDVAADDLDPVGLVAADDGVADAAADDDIVDDPVPTKDAVEAAIKALWVEFKDSADPRLRERLILHYSPLVKYVAGRV